jgi:hypothetical protein
MPSGVEARMKMKFVFVSTPFDSAQGDSGDMLRVTGIMFSG